MLAADHFGDVLDLVRPDPEMFAGGVQLGLVDGRLRSQRLTPERLPVRSGQSR